MTMISSQILRRLLVETHVSAYKFIDALSLTPVLRLTTQGSPLQRSGIKISV
jgi:hypothetical protein